MVTDQSVPGKGIMGVTFGKIELKELSIQRGGDMECKINYTNTFPLQFYELMLC